MRVGKRPPSLHLEAHLNQGALLQYVAAEDFVELERAQVSEVLYAEACAKITLRRHASIRFLQFKPLTE